MADTDSAGGSAAAGSVPSGMSTAAGTGAVDRPHRSVGGPLFSSLHGYRPAWLRGDLVAGLTGVGRPRAGGAGLRRHRRGIARHRSVRGAAGARPLRRLRQLQASGHRADGRHRGPVGRGGPRPGGRPVAGGRVHGRSGPGHRRARGARRAPPARVPGQFHLRARAQGVHHRTGPDDHRGPGAQAARHREGRWWLLRRVLVRAHPPGRHPVADAGRRPRFPGRRAGAAPAGSRHARLPGRRARWDRADDDARPGRQGRRDRGRHRQRPGRDRPAQRCRVHRLPDRGGVMRRQHAHRLRRGSRCGQDLRDPEPLRDRRQPGADRSGRGQPGLGPAWPAGWW